MLFHRFINKTTGEIFDLPTCAYKTYAIALHHLYMTNAIGYADNVVYQGTHYIERVPMR